MLLKELKEQLLLDAVRRAGESEAKCASAVKELEECKKDLENAIVELAKTQAVLRRMFDHCQATGSDEGSVCLVCEFKPQCYGSKRETARESFTWVE